MKKILYLFLFTAFASQATLFAVEGHVSLRKQALNNQNQGRVAARGVSLRKLVLKKTLKQNPKIEQKIAFQNLGVCPVEILGEYDHVELDLKEHTVFSHGSDQDLLVKVNGEKFFVGTFSKPGCYCVVSSAKHMGDLVYGKPFPLHVFYKNPHSKNKKDQHWQPVAKYTPQSISGLKKEWSFSLKKSKDYDQILNK